MKPRNAGSSRTRDFYRIKRGIFWGRFYFAHRPASRFAGSAIPNLLRFLEQTNLRWDQGVERSLPLPSVLGSRPLKPFLDLRAFDETRGQSVLCLRRAFSAVDRSIPGTRQELGGWAFSASAERSRQLCFPAFPPVQNLRVPRLALAISRAMHAPKLRPSPRSEEHTPASRQRAANLDRPIDHTSIPAPNIWRRSADHRDI